MVQQQPEKWPYHNGRCQFTLKMNMDQMCDVLLDRALGFTKEVEVIQPLSSSPVPYAPSQFHSRTRRCMAWRTTGTMAGVLSPPLS